MAGVIVFLNGLKLLPVAVAVAVAVAVIVIVIVIVISVGCVGVLGIAHKVASEKVPVAK
jgi:hypothetical protein